jgi:ADP-ribosylglycohydrolase
MDRLTAIRSSALWAAYGDAIGFISELTTESGLKRRAGVSSLSETIAWTRRVGGRFGVNVELPAGCYSDDTQLRLSVCRSIDGTGFFDVEAFAKVELPLWLSYTLGAGRASRQAATNLIDKNVTWATNFFAEKNTAYINAGGNGAAMRIQPHVWSHSKERSFESLVRDIVRNAITTHGHPRAVLGAVFHGLCLLYALEKGEVPSPDEWQLLLKRLRTVASVVAEDDQLSYRWLPKWESETGIQFEDACLVVIEEMMADLHKMVPYIARRNINQYRDMVLAIDGLNPACRGSGVKTSLLAAGLAFLSSGSAEEAVCVSANALGSDTDTIGTMVGALVGATVQSGPTGDLADQGYIAKEAERLFKISQGKGDRSFAYPDLLKWHPPTRRLDVVQMSPYGLVFSALGKIVPDGPEYLQKGQYPKAWKWYRLSFDQRVLIKHREPVKQDRSLPRPTTGHYREVKSEQRSSLQMQLPLESDSSTARLERQRTLDEAFDEVLKSGFAAEVIGRQLLSFVDSDDSVDRAVAFAAMVSKARQERQKRQVRVK